MPSFGKSMVLSAAFMAGLAIAASAAPFDHDGTYAGSMTLMPVSQNEGQPTAACVENRPVNLSIARGIATIAYADWGRNIIHFRGKLDPTGNIQLWHTNGDGSRSLLIGQIGDAGFTGYMARDNNRCPYKVTISAEAAPAH
jgi:hypothetical protein